MNRNRKNQIRALVFTLSLLTASLCSAADEIPEIGVSKGQKWVFALTGAALLATAPAKKREYAQQGRKYIASVGLVALVGVTLYEQNSKKVALGVNEGEPTLSYSMRF